MTKIAIMDDYQNVALSMADWSVLPENVELSVFEEYIGDSAELARRLAGFEVICIMRERTPFGRELIERLPALKLLVTTGMRNASVDLEAAAEAGVVVSGTRASGYATAELTWGLILAVMRNISENNQAMHEGGWQNLLGHELYGKTLGVIGLGRLGSRVAQVALAFEMKVLAWSENLTPERALEQGAEHAELADLLHRSDIVTIHTVLSRRTRDLLGAAELALMKPSAVLACARSEVLYWSREFQGA